jgi:hypothetical protein
MIAGSVSWLPAAKKGAVLEVRETGGELYDQVYMPMGRRGKDRRRREKKKKRGTVMMNLSERWRLGRDGELNAERIFSSTRTPLLGEGVSL